MLIPETSAEKKNMKSWSCFPKLKFSDSELNQHTHFTCALFMKHIKMAADKSRTDGNFLSCDGRFLLQKNCSTALSSAILLQHIHT